MKVEPTAKVLHREMQQAGFEYFIHAMPNGEAFWAFLKNMSEAGVCTSCRQGSGDPNCPIRLCAKEKSIDVCALCDEYPCKHFEAVFKVQAGLKGDNALLRDQGLEEWAKMQNERRRQNFCYTVEGEPST
jgi:hypothetical protein